MDDATVAAVLARMDEVLTRLEHVAVLLERRTANDERLEDELERLLGEEG